MQKRRVLVVVNYFYPYLSGVSEYARFVASLLASHHDVTVLTGKHRSDLPNQEVMDGVTVIRCDPFVFLDKGYLSISFVRQFRRLANEHDIIHLHVPMLEAGLFGFLAPKPVLVTYHCDMAFIGGFISRLAVYAVRQSMALALTKAQAVVVLSLDYALSSPLAARHKNKLLEITPPNRFADSPMQETTTEHAVHTMPLHGGLSERPLTCGFVGRFVPEKGIDTIIAAAHILRDEPIQFWLAGDYENVAGGSIYCQIKEKIEGLDSKLRLFGRLSDQALCKFYSEIDVLLLPSTNRFEAFGMVQLEAMTFGATVVTSDMPGVRQTVRKTGLGQLCEPRSAESLAQAILRARQERAQLSRSEVKQRVLSHFNQNQLLQDYLSLVDTLATSN